MDYKPHLYKKAFNILLISAIGSVLLPASISAQIPSMVCLGNCPTLIPSIFSTSPTAIPMRTLWQITTVPLPRSLVHTQSSPTNTPTIPYQQVSINATATDVTDTLPSANSSDSTILPALSAPSPSGQVPTGTQASACMSPKDNLFENPFNKDSAHHRPIGTGAVYASDNAAATVDWLRASGINLSVGTRYGDIIFENKESDYLMTIGCDTTWRKPCDGTPVDLIIPTGIIGSTNTDAAANVYEPSTGILHEFYRFYTTDGVYRAGIHRDIPIRGLGHAAPGTNERGKGITASGMSIFMGLLRGHEVNTPGYKIQHALNVLVNSHPGTCTIPMAKNAYVWPAGGTDWFCGGTNCTGNIPYGALLAIPPGSKGGPNLDTLGLSEPGKRVAEALRDYGMYMTDTGGCVAMRTDQFINSTVENQVRTDLGKVYNYVRMVENGGTGPVAGGGDPLASNCAFDAQ